MLLRSVPVVAGLCFPFAEGFIYTHIGYILIIYVLMPFICLVVASEPVEVEEVNITEEDLPIGTKSKYLYSLPLPLFLFIIQFSLCKVEAHLYNVVMLVTLCLMVYISGVVSIGLIEWSKNKEIKGGYFQ